MVYLFPTTLRMERLVNWPTSAGSSVRLLDLRDKILSEASSPRSGGREKREFSSRINVSSLPRPPISPGNSCNHTRYYTAILTCVTLLCTYIIHKHKCLLKHSQPTCTKSFAVSKTSGNSRKFLSPKVSSN